jgi:hypothetical protein
MNRKQRKRKYEKAKRHEETTRLVQPAPPRRKQPKKPKES